MEQHRDSLRLHSHQYFFRYGLPTRLSKDSVTCPRFSLPNVTETLGLLTRSRNSYQTGLEIRGARALRSPIDGLENHSRDSVEDSGFERCGRALRPGEANP